MVVGSVNAWGYETPSGWGIRHSYIGTPGDADANDIITTFSLEDFENVDALSSAWGTGNLWSTSSTLYIGNTTEVSKPAVDAEVAYTMDGDNKVYDKPTYIGGKNVVFHNKTNKINNPYYGTYSFEPVSTGKLIFSGDLYFETSAGPIHVIFTDNAGNKVMDFHWNNGSGTRAFNYEYNNTSGTWTTGATGLNLCEYRTYKGYSIKDFVIDFSTGAFSFTLDYINTRTANNIVRKQENINGTMSTEGLNVSQIRVGTDAAGNSTVNYYTHLDNVELYHLDQTYSYTINYYTDNPESPIKTVSKKAYKDDIINALPSFEYNSLTYTPTGAATTSLTITTNEATNVLNVPVAASVPYTISYKYGEDEIQSENGYAIVGNSVDATITTSLWNEGGTIKYYVADNADTSFEITGTDNNFVVDLRLANTSAVATVNAVVGGTTHKSFTKTGIEGEAATIYYTNVIQSTVDNKFYTVSTDDYSKALVYGGPSIDVTYTLDESIVGYSDVNYTENNSAYSGGSYNAVNSNLATCTLNKGVYRADIAVISKAGSGSNHRQEGVYVGGELTASTSGNVNGLRNLYFVVSADNTTAYVKGQGTSNYSDNLDYVIIRKLYDITDASKIIGNIDYTSADQSVKTSDITMRDGDVYNVTLQNHGTTAAYKNNFNVLISQGGELQASMYADWYDYKNATTNVTWEKAYSADNGANSNTVNWETFVSDMTDIPVSLTITYTNGNVNIIGTAPKDVRTYYWNYTYSGLEVDITVNLSVCLSWFEVLSSSIVRNIANADIADIDPLTYNGSAQSPALSITYDAADLTLNTDYTVAYSNHTAAGTATATVTGIGNYSGTTSKDFTISPKALTITAQDQEIGFGESVSSATTDVDVSGLVTGDALTSITLTPSGTAVTNSGTITPSAAATTNGAGNYDITYTPGNLTIYRSLNVSDYLNTAEHYATYYAAEDLALPTGLEAYIITAVGGGSATATQIDYIPANTGIILYSTAAGTYSGTRAYAGTGSASLTGNKLAGGTTATAISAGDYILYNNEFVQSSADGDIPANRAYLPAAQYSAAKSLRIVFADGTATAIDAAKAADEAKGDWYTISGTKLAGKPTAPGIYISGGKKYVIK